MINPLRRYLQWLFFSMFIMISWFSLCSCEQEIYSLLEETKEEYIFQVYPSMACFPGGTSKLMEFLGENIKYSAASELEGIQGRVVCKFVVSEDGSINDIEVRDSVHPLLDAEVKRVISIMPKWNPGKLMGKPVKTDFILPISFRLDNLNDSTKINK